MDAACRGHAAVVQLLLDAGAEKNVGDMEGHTPLMKSARRCHASVVRLLLEICEPELEFRKPQLSFLD